MKKRRNMVIASIMALVCLLAAGGGISLKNIAFADVSYTVQNGYTTSNVALGKLAVYKDVDGNVIPEAQLASLHGSNYGSSFNPYTALTNGDNESGTQHNIVIVKASDMQGELRTFVSFDLEQTYTINEFALNFWDDHSFIEVVVQVANSADFSDAVTVYNNDTANEMKCGAGSDPVWKDTPNKATHFTCPAVSGRYVRVSGRDSQGGARFTEIEVYGVTSGMAPVAANMVQEKQSRNSNLTLTTEIDGAKIYYTTDGTIPTENSAEYTAPIALAPTSGNKIAVRAVAVKDGVATIPSDFKFDVGEASRNLALGLTPTFDDGMEPTSAWGSDATMSMITDGAENPFNVMGSATPGWLYLDLGAEYSIDKVDAKFYHDWLHAAAIQLSTSPDFTESTTYTVYSNYGVAGEAFWTVEPIAPTCVEYYQGMRSFEFVPVTARYVRVYNKNNQRGSSGWEEIRVWSATVPVDAHKVPAKNVLQNVTPDIPDGITVSGDIKFVTDGSCGSFNNFVTLSAPTWVSFDFGKEYTVDTIKTKFYNNHNFRVVMQLATDANFTQNVHTVYNNDTANAVGVGAGTDPVYTDRGAAGNYTIGNHLVELYFEPVTARYLRVNAVSTNEGNVRFEEVQVWTKEIPENIDEEYPEIQSAIVKAKGISDISVANGATQSDFADSLPSSFEVEDYSGNKGTVSGTWACADYNATTAGDYTFTFTPDSTAWLDLYEILKVKVTVEQVADLTELNAAIAAARALNEEDYVSSSWVTLSAPLAAAETVSGKSLLRQAEVDKALSDLQDAVKGLKLRGVKTELNAMLATVGALTESDYSAASWAALQTEIVSATEIAQNTDVTQAVVDLALADLTAAYNALEKLGDKTALQARYNELKDTQNIYTQATWATFSAALTDAKAVLDKTEAYENELSSALAALNSAYTALVQKANFDALNTAIEAAEALELGGYTANSVAEFNEALTAAQGVAANDENTQTAIDAALAALNEKKAALVEKGDKTELNALLATCNYAEDRYTASTYNAYVAAKQQAETVAASDNAVQTDIDTAKTALQEKIDALKEIGSKTDLLSAITAAEAIEKGNYSEESYKAFQDALAYAKSVAESNDVEQATIDDALALLTAKQEALAKGGKKKCGSSVSLMGSLPLALAFIGCAVIVVLRKKRIGDGI